MTGRAGRVRLGLLAACVAAVPLAAAAGPVAGSGVGEGRRVLGSFQTRGRVEGSVDGSRWLPLYPGAAVLDGMRLRVPGEGSATLQFVGGDQVVFDGHSAGEVHGGERIRVVLDRGPLEVRLVPASTLVVEAGRGVVQSVPGKPMVADAVVRRDGWETTLATRQGVLQLRAAGADAGTVVAAGYQASVGPSGPVTEPVRSPDAPRERDRRAAVGVLGIAGLSPVVVAAVGGVAAAGVGVGAAAATGSFDGDESASPGSTGAASGREGSPFRPIRR